MFENKDDAAQTKKEKKRDSGRTPANLATTELMHTDAPPPSPEFDSYEGTRRKRQSGKRD